MTIKPPLGVKPKRIHDEHRAIDVFNYFVRLLEAGSLLPPDLITESFELMRLLEKPREVSATEAADPTTRRPPGYYEKPDCSCMWCRHAREQRAAGAPTIQDLADGKLNPCEHTPPAPTLPFSPPCTYHRDGQCRPAGRMHNMPDGRQLSRCACQRIIGE